MSKLDKNSNAYTFIYALIVVLVCASLLAVALGALQGRIDTNEDLDKKKNILAAVMPDIAKAEVDGVFDERITQFVIDSKGNLEPDTNAFATDLKKEYAKEAKDMRLPIFEFTDSSGSKNYIIPLRGAGLWGWITVNMALKEDMNTIVGMTFDHETETPGLGAEIKTEWFQSQFKDKKLTDESGEFALDVLKGKGNNIEGDYKVDGISGATITSVGVEDMIIKGYSMYKPFLQNNKTANK